MSEILKKPEDIIDRLFDLHRQATVERSHFYVGSLCNDAAREISLMREFVNKMQRAIEAEGYRVMISVDGGFAALELVEGIVQSARGEETPRGVDDESPLALDPA